MAKSVMTHQFSRVPKANIPRSSFDRSHGHKTTLDSGYLVPILVDEALPGDTFALNMTGFGRMATPIHPIMDNIFMETFFFAVPMRLVWDNWEKFNGEQDNPGDSVDYRVPKQTIGGGGFTEGTLHDYMGIPTRISGMWFNSLYFRAYNLIWNDWFRDQNLQNSVPVPTGDGPDDHTDFILLRRGKRHDYFTSCLPWPQKGVEINLPLGTQAPVTGIGTSGTGFTNANSGVWETGNPVIQNYEYGRFISGDDANEPVTVVKGDAAVDGRPQIWADLSNATASTINELRQAFQIQRMQERDARGGTRYTEIIRSHFGVISPDQRLQRPEFLGGGRSYVNINPVEQTSATADAVIETPQGNLAAYGTVSLNNHGFTRSFTEHCMIIGLVNVRADLTYQQGLERIWSRDTRLDYYWPALSHIGEQAVLNKEIYLQGAAGIDEDEEVFGYQERYAEYRYKPSRISGAFRSDAIATLDAWHLSQDFDSLPALNDQFIQDNPPIDRVLAVQTEPQFLLDMFFRMRCARPMPVYGVPGLIDHF